MGIAAVIIARGYYLALSGPEVTRTTDDGANLGHSLFEFTDCTAIKRVTGVRSPRPDSADQHSMREQFIALLTLALLALFIAHPC